MDIRYHYIRELVKYQHISVTHRPSSQMTADILTKPLDSKLFLAHRNSLLGNLVCGGGVDLRCNYMLQTKFSVLYLHIF